MDERLKAMIWHQFGAAIDMLENAVDACPDRLWGDRARKPEFWQLVYHTLFYLDLYLSETDAGFEPPSPFDANERNADGPPPKRAYSKTELLSYLAHGRAKCRATIMAMSAERAEGRCGFYWLKLTDAELLLYNMRHVQHHTAQLNLLLRQVTDSAPGWVSQAKDR